MCLGFLIWLIHGVVRFPVIFPHLVFRSREGLSCFGGASEFWRYLLNPILGLPVLFRGPECGTNNPNLGENLEGL